MAITNASGTGAPGNLPGDPGSTYNRTDGPPWSYKRYGNGWVAADVLDEDGILDYSCIPMGSTSASVCAGNDSRLSDARTPTAHTHVSADITDLEGGGPHNTTHQNGGADEINVGGLSGVLAEPQTPIAHAAQHVTGGNDVIANAGANAGLMSASDKTKLDGVATGATANDTDANLKNRANHTGSQAQSTITSLVSDLAGKQASLGFTPENAANKNAASGYAGLDGSTKVAFTQLPTGTSSTQVATGDHTHAGSGGDTIAYKTSDQTAIGTSYADVTGTGLSVLANKAYAFEFVLICDADATTTGIDVACDGPASPTSINYEQVYWTSATARTERCATAYNANTSSTASNGTAQKIFRVRGVLRNGANAGTLIARIKREGVGSGPNVRAGSYGRLTPLN